jgi:acetyltransferase/esterase
MLSTISLGESHLSHVLPTRLESLPTQQDLTLCLLSSRPDLLCHDRSVLCPFHVQAQAFVELSAQKGKRISILKVPGAQLSYEVEGSGPLLILIPGAAGVGEVFRPLAHHLSAHYQVVTYDRRGFSRSSLDGPQDYDHRLSTDADDVRRLIEHLTDKPAIVFGNSSGALVALEVLIHFPKQVQTVVTHEPPTVSLLPDAAQWWAFFDGIYDTYRKDGIPKAMHQFASRIAGKEDHQMMERYMTKQANEYTMTNAAYWMEYELRQYP